jgi:hypothetical protein
MQNPATCMIRHLASGNRFLSTEMFISGCRHLLPESRQLLKVMMQGLLHELTLSV